MKKEFIFLTQTGSYIQKRSDFVMNSRNLYI